MEYGYETMDEISAVHQPVGLLSLPEPAQKVVNVLAGH
jgi:hypothetical protein